jgi:hypothetical protein
MGRSFSVLCLLLPTATAAQQPTPEEAIDAMHRAVQFFRSECSADGGYVYRLSADLTKREGEGKVDRHTAWVQPPGTPSVGMAYLEAYRLTGDPLLRDAALETADALIRGQLVSGGWMSHIDFDPDRRAKYAYRVDNPEAAGRNNWTTFDDDKSQSAIRFLVRLDVALGFQNSAVHEAAEIALEACLRSQYPNGAWPQQFREPPDPAEFPVLPASIPADWPREFPGREFKTFYTLNDNTISDLIETLLDARDNYDDQRYLAAARRGGDFLLLAQLPEPQPGWAQQYDRDMQPVWARRFEPPAITGSESQSAMRTLMLLYRRTGDRKYLEPLPRALAYYRRSLLPDGRLARFYELKTNRPLFFTKDYRLTYDDRDVPTHYSFKSRPRLDRIAEEYQELLDTTVDRLWQPETAERPRMSRELARQAADAIAALDERGAWVEDGQMRYHGDDDDTRRVIESQTFARNLQTLARFIAVAGETSE